MRKEAEKRSSPYPGYVTSIFLSLMLSVYLLWPGTGGYESINIAKYQLFLLLSVGYVLIMLILGIELIVTGQAKYPRVVDMLQKASWVQRGMLLFLLFTAVSAWASLWPGTLLGADRKEGLLTITLYVVIFLLVSVFGEWKKLYLYVFGVAVSLFCLLCVLQLLGMNSFYLFPLGYNYYDSGVAYSGAYLGTIGNIDFVAAFLCLAAPLFLCAVVFIKERTRWLLLIPGLLSVVVLLWMKVAAGYVGLFIGMALAVPLLLKATGRPVKAAVIAVVCIFTAALVGVFFLDIGSGTLHEIHEVLHGRWDGSFGSGRLYIWGETLKLVPESLWFGGGPDTLGFRLDASFTRYLADLDLTLVATTDVAHNEYLNIMACQGLLALVSYLGALLFLAIKAVRSVAGSKAVVVLGVPVLCYCIQAFFGISTFFTAPFFWIILGLLTHELYGRKKK